MRLERITEGEMRETLQRAQEIAQQRPALSDDEYESFLRAAEEVGIPRQATLQALRERRLIPEHPLAQDDLVFAPSDDGNLYAAIILSVDRARVTARFFTGGVQTFAPGDVTPASFVPGRKLQYKYPGFGWLGGRVSRYDPITRTVWLTSVWDQQEAEVPLARLRLAPRKQARTPAANPLLWKLGLICGGGGTLLGILLDHLLR